MSQPTSGSDDADPVGTAVARWLRRCVLIGCPPLLDRVRLPLAEAIGRVTARPIQVLRSSPGYDASAMDGVAVTLARVRSAPVEGPAAVLPAAEVDEVDTGDPLPAGRDAVVIREQVSRRPGPAGPEVLVPRDVRAYQHVRPIGEDVLAGELLLPSGHRLRAVDVAAAAAAGHTELEVRRAPVVAVLPTGDEIRPVGTPTGEGEILDTNSLMIAGQLRAWGCIARVLPIEPDDPARIAAAVTRAVTEADLVVLVAGASAGRDDHAAAVIGLLGEVVVHGVAVRPGHPVVLGVAGRTPVLGCPGYPVSAALAVELFAAPLLASLEGTDAAGRPVTDARLGSDLASVPGVEDWVRVRLAEVDGDLVVSPLTRGAGALSSLVRADGLLRIPVGVSSLTAGRRVRVELLREAAQLRRCLVLAGPHDPAVDLLVTVLAEGQPVTDRVLPPARLVLSPATPVAALAALRQGQCHLAGWTMPGPLPDDATGLVAVRLADRVVGLVTAPGNPLGLAGPADLARPGLRLVNRPPGTGSRALLDRELSRLGLAAGTLSGYARQARSGLAVGAAVLAGRADCGIAPQQVADLLGLGFVPVGELPYDLLLPASGADRQTSDGALADLLDLLRDKHFRALVEFRPRTSPNDR